MPPATARHTRKLEALLAHFRDCQLREANCIAQGDGYALLEVLSLKGALLATLLPMTRDAALDEATRQRVRKTLEHAAFRQSANLEALNNALEQTRTQIAVLQQGSQKLRRLQQQCPSVETPALAAALWA